MAYNFEPNPIRTYHAYVGPYAHKNNPVKLRRHPLYESDNAAKAFGTALRFA